MEDVARSTRFGTRQVKGLGRVGGARTLVATLLLCLVFAGQVSIGNSFFTLLPNESEGFTGYVQPYMINVAHWTRQHLGAQQTFATDDIDQLALAAYGEENPANVNKIYPMFFTASMDNTTVNVIKDNHVHYVLLNRLMTEQPPVRPGGSYYSGLEPDSVLNNGPLPKPFFEKFATYTCSHLVYQSGSIQIYDVSKIENGSCVPQLIHKASAKASSSQKSTKPKATS
jgi:hypothetical protein